MGGTLTMGLRARATETRPVESKTGATGREFGGIHRRVIGSREIDDGNGRAYL
jgi:hypothetical protein